MDNDEPQVEGDRPHNTAVEWRFTDDGKKWGTTVHLDADAWHIHVVPAQVETLNHGNTPWRFGFDGEHTWLTHDHDPR